MTGSSDAVQMRKTTSRQVRAPLATRIREALASPDNYRAVPEEDYPKLLEGDLRPLLSAA